MNPNEENIWGAIQRKDGAAFEDFYKEHYKLFFMTACQYLKDTRLAQEVVNDVFLKIWQEAGTITIQTSPKSYIYRSVINRCLNELDKGKRGKLQLTDMAGGSGPEPWVEATDMEDNELKMRLYKAVDELPEQCRKVFMMSRFDGLKQQEIADLLGISIKTVKNHITHALKLLHKVLREWQSLPLWISLIKYFFQR
jgi:RNA polymerase sigma-70 factor (ECF subfamily)